MTVPQIGGDVRGRHVPQAHPGRPRLPAAVSAMDNRPLRWEEFLERIGQTVYLSATPGPYELGRADGDVVEQIIRPTGLVDPEIVVKPTKGQIDDLVHEIRLRAEQGRAGPGHHADQEDVRGPHRLPARARHPGPLPALRGRHPAPDRAARSCGRASSTCWSASTCCARASTCPRCRWSSILDADKEGFLRSGTSLIQTIGRAARNVSGQVHMYADTITAVDGQGDRRDQPPAGQAGRLQHRATASTRSRCARRSPTSSTDSPARTPTPRSWSAAAAASSPAARRRCPACRREARTRGATRRELAGMPRPSWPSSSSSSPTRCTRRPRELQFELAARLRDEINELKKELRGMRAAGTGLSRRRGGSTDGRCDAPVGRGGDWRRHVEGSIPSRRRRHHGPPTRGDARRAGPRLDGRAEETSGHLAYCRRLSSSVHVPTWLWMASHRRARRTARRRRLRHRPAAARAVHAGVRASRSASTSALASLFGLGVWSSPGAIRRRVLRRLADRVQAVDRQPVRLRHHHGPVRGAPAVPADRAARRHHPGAGHARHLHRARRGRDPELQLGLLHLRRVPDLHGGQAGHPGGGRRGGLRGEPADQLGRAPVPGDPGVARRQAVRAR